MEGNDGNGHPTMGIPGMVPDVACFEGSCHGLGLEKASGRGVCYESGGPPWMALVILKGFHFSKVLER